MKTLALLLLAVSMILPTTVTAQDATSPLIGKWAGDYEIAAHQCPGFTRLTGIGGWHDSTFKLFYEACLVYQVILPAPLHDIGTPWSITTFASALATLFDQQEVLVTSTPIKTIRVHGFKKEI